MQTVRALARHLDDKAKQLVARLRPQWFAVHYVGIAKRDIATGELVAGGDIATAGGILNPWDSPPAANNNETIDRAARDIRLASQLFQLASQLFQPYVADITQDITVALGRSQLEDLAAISGVRPDQAKDALLSALNAFAPPTFSVEIDETGD